MAVTWTEEQRAAIEKKGRNILVAAGAGSGKTAVLVERIIQRICARRNPLSVDQLLVLTYTDAAAAEMKRKIANAISERLAQDLENKRLKEQSVKVQSAHISTIHSFCKTILQNHVHQTDLPSQFTLIDTAENEMLRNQALDEVLERYYARIEKKSAFRSLAIGYGGIKSDETLREMVLNLHDFTRSMPFPKQWLKENKDAYESVRKTRNVEQSVWGKQALSLCSTLAHEVLEGYRILWHYVKEHVAPDLPIYTYFMELPHKFEEAYGPLLDGTADFEAALSCREKFQKGSATGMKKLDEEVADRIQAIRKELVNTVMDELTALLQMMEPKRTAHLVAVADRVDTLKQLVRQTERLHQKKKRERGTLDFNDLEHETLHLLRNRDGSPSAVARKLQERFAEILVDEYQDANRVQDTIFSLISGDKKNLFMVGDLKQCIYKFRNAAPSIFAEKYLQYSKKQGGICIRLSKNFRSRQEVIDSVNNLFSLMMTKQLGGVDYTEEEYLVCGADYPENPSDLRTEVLLVDVEKKNYEGAFSRMTAHELEAVTVAEKIRQMLSKGGLLVTDAKTKELRPARVSDIAILMRTAKHFPEMRDVLEAYEIPVSCDVGRGYLDSLEVMTVLDFLRIIDNPIQDIPLLAVLRSAMFRFSADELAQIRLCAKGSFYKALCAAAKEGHERAKEFLEVLSSLREDAVHMGVDELIWKICHELRYISLVGAMPGGENRKENLKLLYEHGAAFEQGVLHGVFHFIQYIQMLRENRADLQNTPKRQKEAVTLMTIHKSKGLEFPVVFVCGTEKYFRETDASGSVIWEESKGIGLDFVDTEQRIRYTTLPKLLVKEEMIRQFRSEEMRLLYVALTRAKEKLVFSCPVRDIRNKWKNAIYQDGKPAASFLQRCTSMRDWILSAWMPHTETALLRQYAQRMDILPDLKLYAPLSFAWVNHETAPLEQTAPSNAAEKKVQEAELPENIDFSRLSYQYPHQALSFTPIKLSVGDLKRRQATEEEGVPRAFHVSKVVLAEEMDFDAAERGTITHFVLQHLRIKDAQTQENIKQQIDAMIEKGMISKKQAEAVNVAAIEAFFAHPLGKRMVQSEKVCREFDFYMEMEAGELNPKLPPMDQKETVLLQGIADCFFYEEDGVVLLDYKTDRVTAQSAPNRAKEYATQIAIYQRGLESVLGCKIKEKYLYFLHCNQAVEM